MERNVLKVLKDLDDTTTGVYQLITAILRPDSVLSARMTHRRRKSTTIVICI